ncbi:hypothetical protein Ancab_021468 [Ancistrocladus abbreviatus]
MMESGVSTIAPVKKATLTPKAIIYQKFGDKASYTIEEVHESSQNGCLGLAIPQKGPCLFRCYLQLPEFSVVTATFKRKKEAEQSAAEMALQKLGICAEASDPPCLDALDELAARLSYLFSDEFLSTLHPLSSHLKASLHREGELSGLVPVSVIIACDNKLSNFCKAVKPMVDSNPMLSIPVIATATVRLSGLVTISEDQLWIRRRDPYPPEVIQSLADQQYDKIKSNCVEATYIPFSLDKAVCPISLNVYSRGYYLDVIAEELGITDASKVLLSRTIGKASSEMRLYFSALERHNLDSVSDFRDAKDISHFDISFNARASYLSGQAVFGDAILASVGFTWKSAELFHEDVPLCSYFRLVVGKTPDGLYKLSREVILAAELPVAFTSKTQWRGSLPRDLLCTFCHQNRLSEPVFSVVCGSLEHEQGSARSSGNSEASGLIKEAGIERAASAAANGKGLVKLEGNFRCEVRLLSKCQDLILDCLPKESYKKQNDAIQNAALRVISWLSTYFKQPDMPLDILTSSGSAVDIRCYHSHFLRGFALCRLMHNAQLETNSLQGSLFHLDQPSAVPEHGTDLLNIEGQESGSYPLIGSLVCTSYIASLVREKDEERVIESAGEFEFEIGTGAVIPCIEAAVMQMTVGQSCWSYAKFPLKLILAATTDPLRFLSELSTKACCLKWSITLSRVTDPLEDRMEQALFNPPLSRQRVEYALQRIKYSSATSLIDFGCGAGSLLDSLIDCPTTLEKIVGVDISQKGLIRAAKILHSKLVKSQDVGPMYGVKQALLYEGSITIFDSRLHGFDIGTCLEVIEHMEEEDACLFGDIVLSSFRPRILIISTPNYEYNVILQRSNLSGQEEDPDEKAESHSQACKFRNHDHKFEWTREQFNRWATGLAFRHNYSVEFSGVGGSAGVEPGFASQIAVFHREPLQQLENDVTKNVDTTQEHYKLVWEWNAGTP